MCSFPAATRTAQEILEEYAAKLVKYQRQLSALGIPLPESAYQGLLAKARLEEDSYRLHATAPPEERRRSQIITLQQELVAEELSRSESYPNQEAKVQALYAILRDMGVDVDKLREMLVSGDRIDTPSS